MISSMAIPSVTPNLRIPAALGAMKKAISHGFRKAGRAKVELAVMFLNQRTAQKSVIM